MNQYSQDIMDRLRALKPQFKKKNIKRLRVFGSVARGDAEEGSDIDLIVDFYETPDLFDFVGLRNDLAKDIGIDVDLMTERSLHPALRDDILSEVTDV